VDETSCEEKRYTAGSCRDCQIKMKGKGRQKAVYLQHIAVD